MRYIFASVLIAFVLTSPAIASDKADVLQQVQHFIAAWDKNDTAAVAGSMTASPAIIDDFPRHYWHGPAALQDWDHDYEVETKKRAVTDPFVKLLEATYVDARGSYAYVVANALYTYKEGGRPIEEKGIVTVALQKFDQNWRIAAVTWTKQ